MHNLRLLCLKGRQHNGDLKMKMEGKLQRMQLLKRSTCPLGPVTTFEALTCSTDGQAMISWSSSE